MLGAFKKLKRKISHKKVLILYIPHPEKWIYCDKRWAEIVSTLAQNHNYNKVEGESLAINSRILIS